MIPAISATIKIMNTVNKNINIPYSATRNEPTSDCQRPRDLTSQSMNQRSPVRIFQKDTELSTKNSTKDNFLDYTFLSHRSQLSCDTATDITKSRDYLFDLSSTWELNMELLNKFISDNYTDDNEQKSSIQEILRRVKQAWEMKEKLKKNLKEKKAKILIERQIIEEYMRKIEENDEYYKEQLKEFEENKDNKEEYIKIFEKKLKEVEIYIQKHTKNLVNSKYEIYKDFKMNAFIESNTNILQRREDIQKEIKKIKKNISEIAKENVIYQEDANVQFSFVQDEENKKKNDAKIKEYMNQYRKQIMVLQMRIKLLKNSFKNMTSTLRKLNLGEVVKLATKNELNIAEENNENEMEKSGLPLDFTKKISNYMDFSIILNKKANDDTNLPDFGLNKSNLTNNMWDISYNIFADPDYL